MECILYDGNDAMYKKTQYISYVLQSGKYVPTSIIYTQKHIDDNTPYTVKNTYSYDGFGNILKNVTSSVYKNNTVTLTTTYTRDSYGNIESEVVEGDNVVSIKKLYEYNTDTKLRLIKSHTNPASVTTTYEYDSWGKLTAKNDISNASNIITTTYAYDDWSNLVKTTNPDGTQTNIKYTCYDQPYYRASTYKTSTTGKSPETVCYDSKGREISSDKIGLDGVSIYRKNIYNAQGKIARVLQKTGSITSWQSFEYDNFGRITAINSPDNTKTTFSHSGRNLNTKAPTGLTKKVYDAWGNTIEVSEYTQSFTPSNKTGTIKYTYCSIGKPVEIVNSGNAITIEYDGAGRKTKLTDPDAGTQTYAYAADGTLLSLTDGRGVTTTYTYDKLGRQVKKICGNIIQTTTFGTSGNALNRVISEECNNGMKEEFEYDNIGRIVNRKRTNENRTFKTSYKYNNKGQLQSIVYPGDVIVEYTYDSNGYMIKASANGKCYFRQGEYGEYDALINKTYFGNLVCKKRFYKHDGTTAYKTIGFSENEELDRINYSYKNSNVECRWRGCITGDFKDEWQKYIDFGYGWETDQDAWQEFIESNDYKYGLDPDPDYNYDYSSCGWEIHGDVVLPKPNKDLYTVEHFTYDYLDRLTAVSKDAPNSTFENIDIKYDVNGNIIYKTGIGSYKYNAVQPHAVSEIEPQTNESGTMHIMPHNIEYNDEGKVSRIYRLPDQRFRANGPISSYIYYYYGPNTEKWKSVDLKRINERIITAKTIYYFDNYEYVEDNSPYEQYFLENGVILLKKDGQLNFYQAFCDNQGSILSVFDEEGNKVFDASYDAWGKQTVTQNDIDLRYGYCGHEMLNEFGLINMTGRIYDPEIGRFISCDNFVQQPDNIQNFNRYSYCLNNPMKYIDPSGEIFGIDDAIIIGVALTVGGAYIGGSVANKNFNPAKWNFSAAETYCGIVVGAACGYALSAGVGISLGVSYSTSMSTVSINLGNIFSTAGTFLNTYGADITLGLATAAGGGYLLSLKNHLRDIQLYTTAVVTSFTINTYKEDICANTQIDYNKFSDYIEPEALNNELALIYRPEYYEDVDIDGINRAWGSIVRMSEKTRPCRPGYVYHLVANQDDQYLNVRTGKYEPLKKGQTWKIGETINGEARYSQEFYRTNKVHMEQRSDYYTDKYVLWSIERWQMINHIWEYCRLPIGNKMAK
ncbi:MAG: RHS repeat-associated core domain-containing protein [Bacteroidaceae bacterium]|nr:RHS repeat-associated core domain-containing protein [Bacteroidaceae bacterium]